MDIFKLKDIGSPMLKMNSCYHNLADSKNSVTMA